MTKHDLLKTAQTALTTMEAPDTDDALREAAKETVRKVLRENNLYDFITNNRMAFLYTQKLYQKDILDWIPYPAQDGCFTANDTLLAAMAKVVYNSLKQEQGKANG